MKITSTIARLLLGAIFLFFGSNLFLNFLHQPLPGGVAGQFFGALYVTHYLYVIAFVQVFTGILLLINHLVPLALILLAPIIASSLCTF
jgi:uncharacterized membrane protein YphA (DoxX/SURF4 family)